MTLKISYNDENLSLVSNLKNIIRDKYPLIDLKSYNESVFKERAKSMKLKYSFGAKLTPFAVLMNDDTPVAAFYSESNSCDLDTIVDTLETVISY